MIMKIPKKIDDALKRRTRYAELLDKAAHEVDKWLWANGIEPDDACWLTGCEIYVNPGAAEANVRKAITEKE